MWAFLRVVSIKSYVYSMYNLLNGNVLVGFDGSFSIINPENGIEIRNFNELEEVENIKVLPDGINVIYSTHIWLNRTNEFEYLIKIWNTNDGTVKKELISDGWIQRLLYLSNGNLVSSSYNGDIFIWNLTDESKIKLNSSIWYPYLFQLPNDDLLTIECFKIKIWNSKDGDLKKEFLIMDIDDSIFPSKSKVLPNGDLVVVVGFLNTKSVDIWDIKNGTIKTGIKESNYTVSVVCALPNDLLAGGTEQGPIRIWNTNIGSLIKTLTGGHYSTVRSLISLSNGRLASQSIDAVIIWNLDDSTIAHNVIIRGEINTNFQSLLLLPNGDLLAATRPTYANKSKFVKIKDNEFYLINNNYN